MDLNKHDHEDRNLQSLLRLALEAEALEESAAIPQLRLVAGSTRPQRKWLLPLAGFMSAAAAVVAVVTLVIPASKPALVPPNASGPTANLDSIPNRKVAPVESTADNPMTFTHAIPHSEFVNPIVRDGFPTGADVGAAESSVVLAIFQGIDGRCSCMHIQKEDWDQMELAGKNGSQLLDVAFNSSCSQPSPKVLIVGISGRRDSLPGPEAAEAFATSLAKMPTNSSADLQRSAYEVGAHKLPAGMMVVTESFGSSRSFPVEPAKLTPR